MRSRQKIIEATLRLIASGGFPSVNVAAVADEAGVSRQTVYSIFGSREALVSQSILDVVQESLREVGEHLASQSSASDFVVELIVVGRATFRAHAVLTKMLESGSGNPVFDVGMISRAIPIASHLLAGAVDLDPRLGPVLDEVAEAVTRMALSVVLFDSDRIRTDDDLRAFLKRWLLSSLPTMLDQKS